jgi:hypothetical protein
VNQSALDVVFYVICIVSGLVLGYIPVKSFWHFIVWDSWRCHCKYRHHGWNDK